MKTQDNYQNLREKWAALTTTLDHEELASRLPIRLDADYVYITFFSKDYRINRSNGHMELIAHPENELGFNELMTIYGLLYYAKPTAKIRGEFVPFRQVLQFMLCLLQIKIQNTILGFTHPRVII